MSTDFCQLCYFTMPPLLKYYSAYRIVFAFVHDGASLDAAATTRINRTKNQGGVFLKQVLSLEQQEMLYLFLTTNMQFFSWDTWEGSN